MLLAALVGCGDRPLDCSDELFASDTTPDERTAAANESLAIAEAARGSWTLGYEAYELELTFDMDTGALSVAAAADWRCTRSEADATADFSGGSLDSTPNRGSCRIGTDDAYAARVYCDLDDEPQGFGWDVESEVAGEITVWAWPGMIGLDPDEEEGMVPLEGWTRLE